MGLNIKKEARATDKQRLSDKPPLTRCGETYKLTTSGSNLKAKLRQNFVLKKGESDFSVNKVTWFQMRFPS